MLALLQAIAFPAEEDPERPGILSEDPSTSRTVTSNEIISIDTIPSFPINEYSFVNEILRSYAKNSFNMLSEEDKIDLILFIKLKRAETVIRLRRNAYLPVGYATLDNQIELKKRYEEYISALAPQPKPEQESSCFPCIRFTHASVRPAPLSRDELEATNVNKQKVRLFLEEYLDAGTTQYTKILKDFKSKLNKDPRELEIPPARQAPIQRPAPTQPPPGIAGTGLRIPSSV
jgi:hypothetical protein